MAKITPDFSALKALDLGVGVIVTASGDSVDFVSRTFFPKLRINEDPVCGSAHANLIPYWENGSIKRPFRPIKCPQEAAFNL